MISLSLRLLIAANLIFNRGLCVTLHLSLLFRMNLRFNFFFHFSRRLGSFRSLALSGTRSSGFRFRLSLSAGSFLSGFFLSEFFLSLSFLLTLFFLSLLLHLGFRFFERTSAFSGYRLFTACGTRGSVFNEHAFSAHFHLHRVLPIGLLHSGRFLAR